LLGLFYLRCRLALLLSFKGSCLISDIFCPVLEECEEFASAAYLEIGADLLDVLRRCQLLEKLS
jgi:hypothetical protein